MNKKRLIGIALALLLTVMLPAERIGARIEMELLSGIVVRGELQSVSGEFIAVYTARNREPKLFYTPRVARIRVLRAPVERRSQAFIGGLVGFAIGAAVGVALDHDPQEQPDMFGSKGNYTYLLTAPAGALAGALMTVKRRERVNLLFQLQGQGEEAWKAAIARLNTMAREPR